MSSFLREELGVAMSGVKWDIGNFKLWQSTRDDIILFVTRQPVLAKNLETGRYQLAVSQFRQQQEGTFKITGGSAIFTITSAVQFDQRAFEQLKEQWRAEILSQGGARTQNPKFVALNVRHGEARVLINPMSGKANEAHNDVNVGTPGGTNSFLVELTELGAQEWIQGIKEKKAIPADVKFTYEYLQMLPTVGARVRVYGRRLFTHLSTQLKLSIDGFWFGGSAQIDAAWENMVRNGTVEITFIGTLPPEQEQIRQNLVTTFADQARQQMFSTLFEPKPNVQPAQAGNTGGLFGGANFALKWRRESDAIDLNLELRFEGWTWLNGSMDAGLTGAFAAADESYINEVNTEMAFPASVVCDADPQLETVALSWSASEGKSPEAPVFGHDGGTAQYVVTSRAPDNVTIRYNAKVNFAPPRWPVIETGDSKTVAQGGNQFVIKPSSWIGRHMIFMFIRDGNRILSPFEVSEDDYAVLNVSYEGPHLRTPIKDSARITPLAPVEFSYPLDPAGRRGQAKFSAFGVIGGRLVRAAEQNMRFDEDAVFILASRDDIQLVSRDSVLPESDELGKRLREAGARPIVLVPGVEDVHEEGGGQPAREVAGTLYAVEYGLHGPALWIRTNGTQKRVRARRMEDVEHLDDEGRKTVRVQLDSSGEYAEVIVVELEPRS